MKSDPLQDLIDDLRYLIEFEEGRILSTKSIVRHIKSRDKLKEYTTMLQNALDMQESE